MDQMILLPGGHIHVTIEGQGKTIVLLPGLGEASPCIEMKPFSEALKPHFQVITLEPFGYGESDPASTPRTVENICDEVHQVMATLNISAYVIAAHSIGGLYALYHVHRYPKEVTGMIALDMSVPQQFDNPFAKEELVAAEKMRKEQLTATSEEALAEIRQGTVSFLKSMTDYAYTDAEMRYYEDMAVKCAHDPTVLDELAHMGENAKKTEELKIPDTLLALMLIAKENTKRLPEWEGWHRALCGERTQAHILDCDHYVHLMQTRKTVALIEQLFL